MMLPAQVIHERQVNRPKSVPPDVLLAKLQADPDNVEARSELMRNYQMAGDKPALAKNAWENQLSKKSDSPGALYNAAQLMENHDPLRSVDLLEQARKVAGSNGPATTYAEAEGGIYAKAVPRNAAGKPIYSFSLQQADALKARLLASSDPELLSLWGPNNGDWSE